MQKNPPHILVCHYASVAQLCQAMATFHDPWIIVPMGTQHIWQKIYAQHQSQAAGFIPQMCSFDQLVPHPHVKAKQQQFWQTYAFTQNYFATKNIPSHSIHAKACQLQQIFLNDMALPLYLHLENTAATKNSTVKNFIFDDSKKYIDHFLHRHMAIDDATHLARTELDADKHYFATYIQHLLGRAAHNKEAKLPYPWSFYQAVQTWATQQNQALLYVECGGLDVGVAQACALMAQHYSGTQYRYQRVYHPNWIALYPNLQDSNVDASLDAKAKTNLSLIEAPSIEKALHATFLRLREIIAIRMPIGGNAHNTQADKKIDIYICIPHTLLKTRFEQWAQTYRMAVHTSIPLGDTPLGLTVQACLHFVAQRWQHGKNQTLHHLDVIIKDILPLLNIPCLAKHVTQSLRNALRHYKSSTWRDFDHTLQTLAASKTSANLQEDGKTADSPLQPQENWQKVQEIMHAFIDDLLDIPNMQNTSAWHHTLWKMFEYLDQSQDISHTSFYSKFGAWFADMNVDVGVEDIDRPLSVTEYAAIFQQWAKQTKVCIPPSQEKQIHLHCLSIQEAAMGAENERDDLIFLSCEQRAFNTQNAFDVQQMHQAMTQQWVNILLQYQHVHVITHTDSQQPQERARIVQAYISHHNIAPQMYDNMAKAKIVAEQIIALPNQGLLKQAIENISASQAVLLYQCPYAYYLKHVEKIPNPSPAPDFAVALEYGQAIHLFLDDFYRHTTPDARAHYDAWHHHAQQHWSTYTKNWPDMHVKQLWQEFLTHAPKWQAWHNAHEAIAYRYQTGECSHQAILHSGERTLKLEGRFDRVDHMQGTPEYLIIDYKYSQAFSKDTWADKSLQLSIYRYLYQEQIADMAQKSKRHGIDIHAKFIFLKAEVDEMSSQEVDENIYLEHMDFLASIPHMTHLKAKPSKACQYCDYRKICPMNATAEDDEMN